jgi:ketosteroid isomerase-like protein
MDSETRQFLADVVPVIIRVETALHDGDATGRLAMWSRTEPLTLFGAAMSGRRWDQIAPIFEALGVRFSACTAYENEIIAAEARADLSYTVAVEHCTCSVDGSPAAPYQLRVTTVFRREDGEWKVVHRHGDSLRVEFGGEVPGLSARLRGLG